MKLYPLRFKPLFRQYIWGGRRLGTELNKPIGSGETYAESWEVVDHGDDQSIVSHGEFSDKTLGELIRSHPIELLGEKVANEISGPSRPSNLQNRFPLLFKFLDANKNLSVQVHPDDEMGATLAVPDLGKTEAWIVMASQPGAKVYAGLKSEVNEQEFRNAVNENRCEEVLHSFEPKVGNCIFIPAGTVHALGEGLLIAEIQQCSNTTFRLFDWGRVDANGNSRELHIESGIAAINFACGPVHAENPERIDSKSECVIECDKFKVVRTQLNSPTDFETNGCFKIVVVISGSIQIKGDPNPDPMTKGCCALIPASLNRFALKCKNRAELLIIER